jgi:hypothetical protein
MRSVGKTMKTLHAWRGVHVRRLIPFAMGLILLLQMASQAHAQYGGGGGTGTGSTTGMGPGSGVPSYGHGKAIGIGVGAAAGGAGVLYLAMHHRGLASGCVQSGDDGLRLVNDKKHQTYALLPGGADVKPGQMVELRGKKSKNGTGAESFEATKVVKNLGSCGG